MDTTHRQPVDWVDPLIDTATRRFFFLTTASHPFGMVNLSPDTRVGGSPWNTGYRYGDEHVRWFSHVHAWQLCGVPVMPTTGEFPGYEGADAYQSRFSHEDEIARPGYHAVTLLDYGIRAELTASERVGFHRYTFNRADDAWVIFDLGADIMHPMSDVFVRRMDARTICGFVENERTPRRKKRVKLFFHAVFDRDIEETRAWRTGQAEKLRGNVIAGRDTGIAFRFAVTPGEVVQLKVAISYCDVAGARRNMEGETPHWNFDAVRQVARDTWNAMLSRIEVEGGTDAQRTKFYTDVFHALKGRRRVSDADGRYLDQTGERPVVRQIPLDATGSPTYAHHNSDAFWGAPWSLNLLWALAWPEVTSSFCNTLVDMYRNGGLIPRGPSGGDYTFVMTSPTSTSFLVSAWMQGIRTFDIETAYEGMLKNHAPGGLMSKAGYEYYSCDGGGVEYYLERGYVPAGIEADAMHVQSSGTMTLEYAYHDWALAQLSQALGRGDDNRLLMGRAQNYRNIWDPETRFMRPRERSGEFIPDFDPMSPDEWEEGNGHHYRWYVPHDVDGLIELFGGRESFIRELNALFENAASTNFIAPHGDHHSCPMDYGNQPCMYLAHLFNYAGAPWLTQRWVRRVMAAAKSDITPHGGYGGDEDQGQMGSLNALMAIGLFSVNGGCHHDPFYELSSPTFDRITIHRHPDYHGGGTFVIETEGNAAGERYIQSAELDGQVLNTPWLPHADFLSGGTLKLALGPQPNEHWGQTPPVEA